MFYVIFVNLSNFTMKMLKYLMSISPKGPTFVPQTQLYVHMRGSRGARTRPSRHELIFLFGGGGGGVVRFHYFFSTIVMFYESVPIQIRCQYEYSGGIGSIRLESRENSLRLAK